MSDGELPLSILEPPPTDTASGQHMPAPEAQGTPKFHPEEFVYSYMNMVDEEEKMKKEALGLTDIPSGTTPYANRTGYKEDDYEVANRFFGEDEEGVDLPPANQERKDYEYSDLEEEDEDEDEDFFEIIYKDEDKAMLKKLNSLFVDLAEAGRGDAAQQVLKLAQQQAPQEYFDFVSSANQFVNQLKSTKPEKLQGVRNAINSALPGKPGYSSEKLISAIQKAMVPADAGEMASRVYNVHWSKKVQELAEKGDASDKALREWRASQTSKQEDKQSQVGTRNSMPPISRYRFSRPEDREKVKQVQGLLGVTPDGYWGRNTEAAWNKHFTDQGKSPPEATSIDEAIRALQPAEPAATEQAEQPGEQAPQEDQPQAAEAMITAEDVNQALIALTQDPDSLSVNTGDGTGQALTGRRLQARTRRYLARLGRRDINATEVVMREIGGQPKPDFQNLGGLVFMALEKAALGADRAGRREQRYRRRAERNLR